MNYISCDKVPHEVSKSLWTRTVILQEKETGREFPAVIVDYCFDDQFGFIVRIKKEDVKGLIRKYKMEPSDRYPQTHVEIDVRDIYLGKHFNLVTELH